jgi:hypothetical protein
LTHAGGCFLCFSRQGKHLPGLPFHDGKNSIYGKPKINNLSGIFFEIRLRRNRRLQRFKFRLYPRRGTKAFLSATVKDVFQRAAVFGRATVAEQPYIPVVGGSVN